MGVIEFNLFFMDKLEVVCLNCYGKCYDLVVLDYCYCGKNIVEVMDMIIEEVFEFFDEKEI